MNKVTPIDPISKIDLRFRHIYKDPMGFKNYKTKIDVEIESNKESDDKRFISLYKKLQEANIDPKELNKLRNKPKSGYHHSDEPFANTPVDFSKQIKMCINNGRLKLKGIDRPLYHVVLSYHYYPESNEIDLLTFPNGRSRDRYLCHGYLKYDKDSYPYIEISSMNPRLDAVNYLGLIEIEV